MGTRQVCEKGAAFALCKSILACRRAGTMAAGLAPRNERIVPFPNKREGFQGIAEEFVPIAWGDREYLVPADDIVGFCK